MSIPASFTHYVKGGLSTVYGYFVGAKGSEVQIIDNSGNITPITLAFRADAGSTDDYAITLSPAPAAYTTGMLISFTANTANTGACTVNVNSLGAKSLKRGVATNPGNNFIKSGSVVVATYDGTNFQMIQPAAQ